MCTNDVCILFKKKLWVLFLFLVLWTFNNGIQIVLNFSKDNTNSSGDCYLLKIASGSGNTPCIIMLDLFRFYEDSNVFWIVALSEIMF